MLVVIFLNGLKDGLVRECSDFECACTWVQEMGEERVNKVVITDLQPTESVTKDNLKNLIKF